MNKGNNGKSPETLNAYNEVVDMLNMMKIFPTMCIKLLREYVRGPDFNIPNDPTVPNRELNPKNVRCEPYMKVAYRLEDCPNQTTVLAFTTLQQSQPASNFTGSSVSPVQLSQQQQYGGKSSTTPLGTSLTINNNTFFSTYDGRNQYSSV